MSNRNGNTSHLTKKFISLFRRILISYMLNYAFSENEHNSEQAGLLSHPLHGVSPGRHLWRQEASVNHGENTDLLTTDYTDSSQVFNTTAGHFDELNNGHVSFYKTDYIKARSSLSKQLIKHESELEEERREEETSSNLCLVLRQEKSLHALRAPDPSLMLRYEEVFCEQK